MQRLLVSYVKVVHCVNLLNTWIVFTISVLLSFQFFKGFRSFCSFFKSLLVKPEIFLLASYVADPPTVNLVAFPLAFLLHPILGAATLLSTNCAEWLNGILKWVMCGERPYWWVGTLKEQRYPLKQFPITCETGPGSPSGHCMVFVAGWLPVLLYLIRLRKASSKILYPLFVFATGFIAVSRVYVAAHFPHQVVFGSFLGIVIGHSFFRWASNFSQSCVSPSTNDLKPSVLTSPIILVVIGLVSFALSNAIGKALIQLGVDVDQSYRLAKAHCAQLEWVRPSTLPEASYARVMGACLSLGLSFLFRPLKRNHLKPVSCSLLVYLVATALTIATCQCILQLLTLASVYSPPLVAQSTTLSRLSLLFHMTLRGAVGPLSVTLTSVCFSDREKTLKWKM